MIPKAIYDTMLEHCKAGLPNEACGFLGGNDGSAEEIYPMTNAAASPVLYRPSDREMLEAMNDMDARDLTPVAIFHSHVASPPYPSQTDIRHAHYPDSVYIIVSLANRRKPESKGYLIQKEDWRSETGEVVEVELVVA